MNYILHTKHYTNQASPADTIRVPGRGACSKASQVRCSRPRVLGCRSQLSICAVSSIDCESLVLGDAVGCTKNVGGFL